MADSVLPSETPTEVGTGDPGPKVLHPAVELANKFDVKWGPYGLEIGKPPVGGMGDDDAMILAAWLIKLTGQRMRFAYFVGLIDKAIV